jgi:cell pole-organizing protein PopZ
VKRLLLAVLLCSTPSWLLAQTDYINTDRGRPLRIEDAMSIERYSLEFQLSPFRLDRSSLGDRRSFEPSLTYGIAALTQLEIGTPFVSVRTARGGYSTMLGGIDLSLLRTLRIESEHAPSVALSAHATLPAGAAGPRSTTGTIGALLTRSFSGPFRIHANADFAVTSPAAWRDGADGERWTAGIGIDRPFALRSTLIGAEVFAEEPIQRGATEWNVGVGVRTQLTPRWHLDAGFGRALTGRNVATRVNAGLTYAFGLRRFVSSRAVTLSQPADQLYYPASHNWKFRDGFPRADRLFNAFDYGHAILYERLWRDPGAPVTTLERDEFTYIADTLLIRPPRLAIAERAVAPLYARLAPEALEMFDWAHLLHRQVYDILADSTIADADRDTRVQTVLAYYLSRRDLAFSTKPKSMDLMQGQPYSLAFRKRYPKFNGLIWAYHWLQMGLYEPLLAGSSVAERERGIDATVQHFFAMLSDAPSRLPTVMPMSPAIAPRFTARYPTLAVIFDNLHSMHDVISDVLANPSVPRDAKRQTILAAAAAYRDDTTEVTSVADWLSMAAMMGLNEMGGPVPGATPVTTPMSASEHAMHHPTAPVATSDSAFAAVQSRGKTVMGVDQFVSKHTFEDLADGGRVVLVIDPADAAGVHAIRDHMQTLAAAMTKGDFSMSAMVHATEVPGTKTMAIRGAAIAYRYEELPGGGAVRITVSNDLTALAAVREFLLFQRSDHRAPD